MVLQCLQWLETVFSPPHHSVPHICGQYQGWIQQWLEWQHIPDAPHRFHWVRPNCIQQTRDHSLLLEVVLTIAPILLVEKWVGRWEIAWLLWVTLVSDYPTELLAIWKQQITMTTCVHGSHDWQPIATFNRCCKASQFEHNSQYNTCSKSDVEKECIWF